MAEIKFSHVYGKLWKQSSAELIAVRILNKPEDFNEDLKEYDTKYKKGIWDYYYPVPDGKLLQLIFIGNKHIPFCTLRSWNEEKEKYYRGLIGQKLAVVVAND